MSTALQQEDVAHSPKAVAAIDHETLPSLYRDPSFLGMAATQFLGAFNDNLFKQLILLLATPSLVESATSSADDRQGPAQAVFSAGFLIFSGFAGFLSDRFSKRPIVILSKVAEIVVMLMGLVGFLFYDVIGFEGMLVVLFLMGTQSAFFGPSKYGILPEMLRAHDLPRANGIFLMLTFLAIIFGTALAGRLWTITDGQIWWAQMACVVIAGVGTLTSFLVRRLPAAQPNLKHEWSAWGLSRDVRQMLRSDRELLWALAASTMFWMVGGMVLLSVNALGKTQLGLDEAHTSNMAASIGAGIALGCIAGGYLSQGRVRRSLVTAGAVGTVITLGLLSLPGSHNGHWLGYPGSIPVLIAMGAAAGMFVVPVQVLLQSRPPKEQKGRMIGTMNQCQWVGVIAGALLFDASAAVLDAAKGPRCAVFAVTAALMLPVALFYRPRSQTLVET
jgi:acyl-[acyl-carrier-protein]-phospholipid O-acyltransferase/long-chain-fatty-acid--[acyl-carrier-protein] ligase